MPEDRLDVLIAMVLVPEVTARPPQHMTSLLTRELWGFIGAPGTELQVIGIHAAFGSDSDQCRSHILLDPKDLKRTVLGLIGYDTEAVLSSGAIVIHQ